MSKREVEFYAREFGVGPRVIRAYLRDHRWVVGFYQALRGGIKAS